MTVTDTVEPPEERPRGIRLTAHYTGGGYLASNPRWHEEDADWKAEQVARLLRDHPVPHDTVCDIGCGTGGVLAALRQHLVGVRSTIGYEPSPQAVGLARQLHPEIHVEPRVVEPGDGRYDVALVLDVFEHVEDYFGFLRQLHGVADRYVFHIPLELFVLHLLFVDQLVGNRTHFGHLHHFSRETALATLEGAGFDVVDAVYTPSSVVEPAKPKASKVLRPLRAAGAKLAPDLTARTLGGFSLLVLAQDGEPTTP